MGQLFQGDGFCSEVQMGRAAAGRPSSDCAPCMFPRSLMTAGTYDIYAGSVEGKHTVKERKLCVRRRGGPGAGLSGFAPGFWGSSGRERCGMQHWLSLIHISEPTRRTPISYAV